ncbi:MAG: hypothetical protein R3F59_32020 [Myxococcota bacterium]
MGDRASYAVRESGQTDLFYGNWGAPTLLADVFWGPEPCEAAIRAQEHDDQWLDDVFGEAAVAQCWDTRTVTFFDGWSAADVRETAAVMMRTLWPGWTVRLVHAVSEVAAAVDVDLVSDAEPSPVSSAMDRDDVTDVASQFLPHGGLIVLPDSRRVAEQSLLQVLWVGPDVVGALGRLPTLEQVQDALWTRGGGPPEGLLTGHFTGAPAIADLDPAAQTLRVTLLDGPSAVGNLVRMRELGARWPGWTVEVARGTVASHFAGRPAPAGLVLSPPPRPLPEQLAELRAQVIDVDDKRAMDARWLARAGVSGQVPGPLPISREERRVRWARALEALGAEDPPEEDTRLRLRAAWSGRRTLGLPVALPGGGEVAVVWADRQTRLWRRDADGFHAVTGPLELAGDLATTLVPAPSGAVCIVAGVQFTSQDATLLLVDLASGAFRRLGGAVERAFFWGSPVRLVWAPDSRRFALEVVDRTLGRLGTGCVEVWDAAEGWVGRAEGASWPRWDGEVLQVHRFDGERLVGRTAALGPSGLTEASG